MRFDIIDLGEVTIDLVRDPNAVAIEAKLRLHSMTGVTGYVERTYYIHPSALDVPRPKPDEEGRVEWELMQAIGRLADVLTNHTKNQLNGTENTDDGSDDRGPAQPAGLGEPGQL